jgi:hypothetical protein
MFETYKEKIVAFMQSYDYPIEAQEEIVQAFEQAFSSAEAFMELKACLQAYSEDCEADILKIFALCRKIAENGKGNVYPVVYPIYMSVLILLAEIAKKHYEAKALPADMWKDNFTDLRYKLYECKLVKGVWGTFVPTWYARFLDASRFTFGKLQFEIELF